MITNERLPAHPRRLPVLTLLSGAVAGLVMLGAGPARVVDALLLLVGMLGVGPAGEGWLPVLLWRMCRTFTMVSLALVIGMSSALAVAVLMGGWWRPLRICIGWLSRLFGALPPMAWALGWLFVLVQQWGLPVESLFPSRPGAALDSWMMKSGRALWSQLAPALALALPVFALTLRACLVRLDHLWKQPLVTGLRSQGFSRGFIRHHHLTPRLWPHVVRLAWPVVTLLLGFAVAVEEVFMMDGWGSFVAQALRARDTASLAAGIYAGGLLLALWFWLFSLMEKPLASMGRLTPLRLPRNRAAWVAGGILVVVLLSAPWWPVEVSWWKDSLQPWAGELSAAWLLAGAGLVICLAGWFSGWSLAVILVVALFLPAKTALWLLLALAVAVPEWLRGRRELQRVRQADFLEASRMLGGSAQLSFWWHAWRVLVPTFGPSLFRMAAAALIWTSSLTFFGYGEAHSLPEPAWGALTQTHTATVLDNPWPALMPMIWVGFWCLCFQWFARGFGTGGLLLPASAATRAGRNNEKETRG